LAGVLKPVWDFNQLWMIPGTKRSTGNSRYRLVVGVPILVAGIRDIPSTMQSRCHR
jgi:hypothetical protein